jgi:hypothetical protein
VIYEHSLLLAPEDSGTPAMILYGTKVKLHLRRPAGTLDIHEAVIYELYGSEMRVIERISGSEWAMIGAIARPSE